MKTTTTTSGPLTIGIGVAPTEQEREAFRAGLRREVAKRDVKFITVNPGAVYVDGRWYSEDDPALADLRGSSEPMTLTITVVDSWTVDSAALEQTRESEKT